MKRKSFHPNIYGLPLILVTAGISLLGKSAGTAMPESTGQPNILWITIEDTSPEFIGSYGNKQVKTPVMDSLADNGVRFTSAFSTGPVCAASRSTIITGCSTEAMGTGNHRSKYPIPSSIKGFPYFLKQAGYYTSNNKKTDYNIAHEKAFIKEAWDESSSDAGWWKRKSDQPFFSVFNLMDSHQSRTMTNPYNWYKEHILDKLSPGSVTSPDSIPMPPFYRNSPEMRKDLSRVYNSLNQTDREIGQILSRLRQNRLDKNTIVFVFADHGEGIPKGKTSAIGLGYRVPFFVYFPPRYRSLSPWPVGKPDGELISFEDLAPTLLSLAGVHIPDYMTGRPFLGAQRQKPRAVVYGSRNRIDESPDLTRSATDGRFYYTRIFMPQLPMVKFIKYMDVGDITRSIRKDWLAGKLDSTQAEMVTPERPNEYLYDMNADKWEIHNLAGNPAYQGILNKLRKAVQNHILESHDVMFLPEYQMTHQINQSHSTPYEFRMNRAINPIEQILKTANLVGQGTSVLPLQLKKLKDKNPTVRYWAAVGLDAQKDAVFPYKEEVMSAMQDASPSVQIQMVGIVWKLYREDKAKQILEQYAMSDNQFNIEQALQTIEYLRDNGKPFVPIIEKVKARFSQKVDGLPDTYNIHCLVDETLHFLTGAPLYYHGMEKYMPRWQLEPNDSIRFTP